MLVSKATRLTLAAIVAITFAVTVGHSAAYPAAAAGDCTVDATMDGEEQAFLVLINSYRAQNGLVLLTPSYMLTKASAWKSKDLASNNYFAHDDLTRTWSQRVRDCGYGFNTSLGENIAAGYTTAQQVFDGWKGSPGHNANMLGASYTSIGIGRYYVAGSTYGWYWTTDFGGFSDGWATITDSVAPITPAGPPAAAPTLKRTVLGSAITPTVSDRHRPHGRGTIRRIAKPWRGR